MIAEHEQKEQKTYLKREPEMHYLQTALKIEEPETPSKKKKKKLDQDQGYHLSR